MPVLRPKQSARFAAQLNSPPLTWIVQFVALRNGMMPGIEPVDERAERDEVERAGGLDVETVLHAFLPVGFTR